MAFAAEIPLLGLVTRLRRPGKSDASEELVFVSGYDGEILGTAVGTVWERNSNNCSILPQTQRHEPRTAAAQPEVFHIGGVAGIRVDGRGQFGVGFQPKKSSFLEIAKRCETGRVSTLRQHTEPIALSMFTFSCHGESSAVTCVTPQCDGRLNRTLSPFAAFIGKRPGVCQLTSAVKSGDRCPLGLRDSALENLRIYY